MTNRTPHHIEARMQRALEDVKRLARDRGLESRYATELFGLEHAVDAALEAHAWGLAEHASEAIRRFTGQLLQDPPCAPAAGAAERGSGPADDAGG